MTLPLDFCQKLHQSLVEAGVNAFKALTVAEFVTQCYDLLLSAHLVLTQPARWEQFCATRGATTKRRHQIQQRPDNLSETAITAHLSLEANQLLKARSTSVTMVPANGVACVVADHTSPSDEATGSSSKRPDLVFYPAALGLQLTFAMEAKIIRLATGIGNDLLGAAGFGCFVRALDPYESNGVVGLLGYVEPTAVPAMIDETERCMQGDTRFVEASAHDFVVNTQGRQHHPRTVVGRIVNSDPKVCIASMLPVELTATPQAAGRHPTIPRT